MNEKKENPYAVLARDILTGFRYFPKTPRESPSSELVNQLPIYHAARQRTK